jgi:flagellar protein FliO/FliZ
LIAWLATAAPAAAPLVRPAAQAAAHAANTSPGPSIAGAFFALLAVLALIIGLAWLLRRIPGSGFRPADGLRVVASLHLGSKERAVVVEVGGQQLLLGVTPNGITCLHTLAEPLPAPEPARMPNLKSLPDFAQLLSQRLRKDS